MNYSTFSEPDTDQVYVSGLPDGTTEEDLAAHFGSIGMIKEDKNKGKLKIWLYRDKATGEMKGDGTVSYVDPFSAASAVEWFHNKEFKGATISVSLALKGGPQAGGRQSYPRGPSNDRAYGGPPPGERAAEHESAEPLPLPPRVRPDASQRATPIAGPPPTLQPPGPPAAPTEQFHPQPNGAAIPSHAGPGHGSAPPPPKELREGDWLCPGCGNTNFAFRGKCNRCQTAKPGSFGGGRGRGRGRGGDDAGGRGGRGGRGKGVQAAPQGPQGLFSEGDWACPSCGNVNWARRQSCNTCNGPKPGTVDTNREGVGGGFKELDEAEMAEAKRRRLENEEKSMYDEFGRLKKKFRSGQDRRAREEAALARLRGDPVPGEDNQESEAAKTDKPAAEKLDKGRDRDSDKDHGSRAYNRGHDRERDRPRERERGKDQQLDRRNDRDRWRRR